MRKSLLFKPTRSKGISKMDLGAVEKAYAVDGVDISGDDGSLWTPDDLLKDMERSELSVTLVRQGTLSLPVAYSVFRPAGRTVWIRKIGVDRFHRLRGIGRNLYQTILEQARIGGDARCVRVFVPAMALNAQKFFRACGMVAIRQLDEYELDGKYLFEKEIR